MLEEDRPDVRIEILWLFAVLERTGVTKDIFLLYEVTGVVEKTTQILQEDESEYIIVNAL